MPSLSQVDTEERTHHPYSPSQLQSLEVCPCYRGKDSKHERTIAGTLGHKMVETGEDNERLSDRDAMAAIACMDFVETRRQAIRDMFPGTEVLEIKEIYLPIDDLVFDDAKSTTAGYVDLVLLNQLKTYADVTDYKFGYWTVEEAANNLQALAYMLGLFKMFPMLQKIRFNFKLPNIDGFSWTELTRADIPATYLRIQVVVARARKARQSGTFESANPTCPLCSFCSNLGDCPKVAGLMLGVAKKFYPMSVPDDVSPLKLLSSQDTNMCLRLAQTAKAWAESFRARVTDRVLRGDAPIPQGHHIERRDGNRKVAKPDVFKTVTLKYVSAEEYANLCSVPGFGEVESLISDKAPRGTKESTVERYRDELAEAGATIKSPGYAFLKASNDRDKLKAERQRQNTDAHDTTD